MACSRGKAAPDANTKLRLFANSAGYCQKPDCLQTLFVEVGSAKFHIAEMAHIIAASNKGPRAKGQLSRGERGAYDNLILLCANCHTKVDKAAREFPEALLHDWKAKHAERLASAFGAIEYSDRFSARAAIEPLLNANRAIFELYGPDLEYRFDPESELADAWQRKVIAHILPNNRKALRILDANRKHLTQAERRVLEDFRQHVDDLEHRHLGEEVKTVGARFPSAMNTILTVEARS